MNAESEINLRSGPIQYRLKRSNRKTLAVTVQPDLSVVVTAPLKAALQSVQAKVRERTSWIRRQQQYFSGFLPLTPPRRYVSGETYRYLGRQYRLKVVKGGRADVKLRGRFIYVQTPRKDDISRVRRLLEEWYLQHAKERLARSFSANVGRFGARLTNPPRMQVRRMPKRWGSWTRRSGVWLNPELVKTPASCIDYVVTHELCHAVHGNHGRNFYELLKRVMPDWKVAKIRLEAAGVY